MENKIEKNTVRNDIIQKLSESFVCYIEIILSLLFVHAILSFFNVVQLIPYDKYKVAYMVVNVFSSKVSMLFICIYLFLGIIFTLLCESIVRSSNSKPLITIMGVLKFLTLSFKCGVYIITNGFLVEKLDTTVSSPGNEFDAGNEEPEVQTNKEIPIENQAKSVKTKQEDKFQTETPKETQENDTHDRKLEYENIRRKYSHLKNINRPLIEPVMWILWIMAILFPIFLLVVIPVFLYQILSPAKQRSNKIKKIEKYLCKGMSIDEVKVVMRKFPIIEEGYTRRGDYCLYYRQRVWSDYEGVELYFENDRLDEFAHSYRRTKTYTYYS